ncbi:VCBS domain-containing protein, partial [Shewanella algae]|uniref:VCBS domain-containing protein n=1 Tax=Shewanella algae TaxID=38313 RepID=UPI00313EDB80
MTEFSVSRFPFTPHFGAINALGEGAHISLPIAITVSDGIAAPVQSTITIEIDGANDAPTLDAVKIHL